MKNTDNKREVFSQVEKNIAISILEGMPVSKCTKLFEMSKVQCQTILNIFCRKSNPFIYEKLQKHPFIIPNIGKLRSQSKTFISDSKKLENVTIDSSIWALPDVPMMTLNAIWKRKSYTIKDLLQYSQRDLLRFHYIGKIGFYKLLSSLKQYGFSIKE